MRMKERRERVKAILDYKPDSQVASDDIDQALNDALEYVWDARAWTFAEAETTLNLTPDVSDATNTLAYTNDSRSVFFASDIRELYQDANGQRKTWVGQFLCIDGFDYRIMDVPTSDTIILWEPVRSIAGTFSNVTTSWSLKAAELYLPEDLGEILGLADKDIPIAGQMPRKFSGLPARKAEDLDLRLDQTGTPSCYIVQENLNVPPAGSTALQVVNNPDAMHANDSDYGFYTARYMEITWAFASGGRFGALAEPAVCQITEGVWNGQKVVISLTMPDGYTDAETRTPDYANRPWPLDVEGWKKVFFFNDNLDMSTGLRRGLPCWKIITQPRVPLDKTDLVDNQQASYPLEIADTSSTATLNNDEQMHSGNRRVHHDPDGVWQRVRLWPRPSSVTRTITQENIGQGRIAPAENLHPVHLRYRMRPPTLSENGDTDPMPHELHKVVVQKAVAILLPGLGDPKLAADYELLVTTALKRLSAKYTSRIDETYVRGQWGGSGGYQWPTSVVFTRTN